MKTRKLLATALILIGAQTLMAQDHVTNIHAVQNDKMVTITYDLNLRSDVRLFISIDDGQTYTDTMKVTGYVNRVVPQGKNRTIRWQAFNDLGYGDYPEIRFKFITEEKQQVIKPKQIPERTFITLDWGYNFDRVASSVGITGGHVKKFGWFASIMTNFNYKGFSPDAISDMEWRVLVDDKYWVLPFYEESAYSELSIIGGGLMRLTDWMYLKAGLGYGHRSVSCKTYDGRWVRNGFVSSSNVDVDLGMMFNFSHFVVSLDGVVNMKGFPSWFSTKQDPVTGYLYEVIPIFEAKIGLGYSF